MKIDDLQEKGKISNFLGGISGAYRARSKNPKTAKSGERALSAAGQKGKKKRMADAMFDKWLEQANKIRSQENAKEPELNDFNNWVAKFMGADRKIDPHMGKTSDREVKKYLQGLVNKFYQAKKPEKKKKKKKKTKKQSAAAQQPAAQAPVTQKKQTDKFRRTKKDSMRNKPVESLARELQMRYLTEAKNEARIQHIEDLVFKDGYAGAEAAITYIEQIVAMLMEGTGEKATITTKWDGSPAIVCGVDPEDGKFFVGTKAVFRKNDPAIIKTPADADRFFGGKGDLADKMKVALKHLPKLDIQNVLMGDFMFTPEQLETQEIDGEKMVAFTPNTITYATPADSHLADVFRRAKLGVVFHTAYEGDTIATMSPVFGASVAGLTQTKDVWVDDATYKDLTGAASFTPKELAKIKATLKAIGNTMKKVRPNKFNEVIEHKEFAKFINPFVNAQVRAGNPVASPTQFLKDFFEFYRGKMHDEIEKIKAEKGEDNVGVKNRLDKIRKKEEFLEDHANALLGVLSVYKRLTELKLMIVNKLYEVEGLGTFIRDGDGYKVTDPEGFVAIGHDGNAVKLVDRLEFSKNNFNMVHGWQQQG